MSSKPRSLPRRLARAGLITLGVAVPAAATATYVGMRILTDAPQPRRRSPELRARFFTDDDGTPTVAVTGPTAAIPGTWGLEFAGGYARIEHPLRMDRSEDEQWIIRPYRLLEGKLPATADRRRGDRRHSERRHGADRRDDAGQGASDQEDQRSAERRRIRDRRRQQLLPPWPVEVVLSPHAFPRDPQVVARECGATWSVDSVSTSTGERLVAWRFVPPEPLSTWVVGIHGRGAERRELFRLLEIALAAGFPCLIVSYRTDVWTASPTPVTTLGQTEWEDVAAAVRMLIKQGAEDVILAGCSLGGAIAAQVLRRSAIAPYVTGVILDAPALTWAPILRHVANARRLPGVLVPPVMLAARMRARLDWARLDHLAGAGEFQHPILLIHGGADDVIPIWLSDAFAEARPDLITYLRVDGAGHVTSWNWDAVRYTATVQRFLADTRAAVRGGIAHAG